MTAQSAHPRTADPRVAVHALIDRLPENGYDRTRDGDHRSHSGHHPHVGPHISTFLGPSTNLRLHEACKFGSAPPLEWIWGSSCASIATRKSGWSLHNYLRSDPHYHEYQFQESLKVAAGRGGVALVEWVLTHFQGFEVLSEVDTEAAKHGHLHVLQHLFEHDHGRDYQWESGISFACDRGNLPMAKWMVEHPTGGGHVDVLEYLFEVGFADINAAALYHAVDEVVIEAAKNGHLEILKYFHDLDDGSGRVTGATSTKWRRTKQTIEWWARSSDAIDGAAGSGHLEIVKWLHDTRSVRCSTKAMDYAARSGQLEMVKWLHANTPHTTRFPGFAQIYPKDNRLWVYPSNLFDVLLFLQGNYPKVFTPEFARGTKSDLHGEYFSGSDALVEAWLNEHYPGPATEERTATWRNTIEVWTAEHSATNLPRHCRASVIGDALLESLDMKGISKSWRSTGLWPVNREKVLRKVKSVCTSETTLQSKYANLWPSMTRFLLIIMRREEGATKKIELVTRKAEREVDRIEAARVKVVQKAEEAERKLLARQEASRLRELRKHETKLRKAEERQRKRDAKLQPQAVVRRTQPPPA
ncbi:hypothetical protein PHYSODRAFT_342360 [Phytophthora sojae]|uniref:Uncharacterized protein n=1 Tax=Phytophthora sojae (strain P6497) TaxID=1094619 RepID=G5AG43_PHYSP|nr:hypothetical protein PHYSODRAFT_342360 [Phytophthora sojae]EGZ05555.1 hypothetical protein PHYSODRAFT_342360 [Phytophthora sojae]|eukprot:XP_009539086.1 hypothetical protein PHYSODRAFT_342360 [Phytophthora sojae]